MVLLYCFARPPATEDWLGQQVLIQEPYFTLKMHTIVNIIRDSIMAKNSLLKMQHRVFPHGVS